MISSSIGFPFFQYKHRCHGCSRTTYHNHLPLPFWGISCLPFPLSTAQDLALASFLRSSSRFLRRLYAFPHNKHGLFKKGSRIRCCSRVDRGCSYKIATLISFIYFLETGDYPHDRDDAPLTWPAIHPSQKSYDQSRSSLVPNRETPHLPSTINAFRLG